MKVENLWWECPKCKSKVTFGIDLSTLFCEEDSEAYFCARSGVPFYAITCDNNKCDVNWVFSISSMFED